MWQTASLHLSPVASVASQHTVHERPKDGSKPLQRRSQNSKEGSRRMFRSLSLSLFPVSRSFARFLRHARLKQAAAAGRRQEDRQAEPKPFRLCDCCLRAARSSRTAQAQAWQTDTHRACAHRMPHVQRQSGKQTGKRSFFR